MRKLLGLITFLFIFICGGLHKISAQQIGQYTQYMYAHSLINPAYAGLDEVMNVNLIYRTQWVGVAGAPVTQVMALTTPLGYRLGMGVSLIRDEIGPAIETNTALDIAYLLRLNDYGLRVSFGMKGGFQILDVDYNKLTTQHPHDPALNENISSRVTPSVGTGIFLYNEHWYLGLSSPNLLSTKHYNNATVSMVSSKAHFYFAGGMNFRLSETLKFKPAFLVKQVSGAPFIADVSLNFMFNNRFTAGASYRYKTAFSGLVKFKVNAMLSLGYAYDTDTTAIGHFSKGSHEVLLTWSFNKLMRGLKQTRWMY